MKNILKVKGEKNIKLLILSFLITYGTVFLSIILSTGGKDTYNKIIKPVFAPPVFVFPIVWIILYCLMSISFYRILLSGRKNIGNAKSFYYIQLFLNFLWLIILLKFRLFGLAFFEILLLVIFVVLTIFKFYKIDKKSACLIIPYIIWTMFTGVLNYCIWALNEM